MNLEGGDRIRAIANIAEADLVPCHLEFLINVQVKASLMVPIWMGQQLWGLLLAHECRGPRVWRDRDIDLLEQLADQAAIAIQQAELYEQSCTAAATATAQARQLTKAAEQQQALFEVITKIRESLDLQTIFQATAREVRHLLNADRVGVFCFEPSSNYHVGEFVSEDVTAGLTSVLSAKVRDDCFGDEYAPFYLRGRIQVVHDVRSANLSDCHQKILERFQIKANLVVPLIQGDELWGLLCVHQCQAPRRWTTAEIDFVTQIAAQLGVAIQQAELLTQTQRQAEQLTQALQELQQTQTQLIQTEKMSSLGQLVAGVAHEINNPVNFIYGNVNYASEYVRDLLSLLKLYQHHYPAPEAEVQAKAHAIDLEFLADDLPKMLSSMRIGADRIRQIVLSLRNFSRLDQAEKKPVDIHEGIDSTLLILQHRFRATSDSQIISVVKHYGELPLVECYAGQLNQVFMNILSNAIDALQLRNEQLLSEGRPIELGQITITTQLLPEPGDRGGSRVVIQIADNGPGMPETVRSRVFDPFFTTKPVGQGTGLGLSISYQVVVEKHGGVLKCISEPGQGTEFWIEIPIYQGQPST
jgi:signal transduction histidine kinase